jgi:hypothetical protein
LHIYLCQVSTPREIEELKWKSNFCGNIGAKSRPISDVKPDVGFWHNSQCFIGYDQFREIIYISYTLNKYQRIPKRQSKIVKRSRKQDEDKQNKNTKSWFEFYFNNSQSVSTGL